MNAPIFATVIRSIRDGELRLRRAEPADYEGVMLVMAAPKAFGGTLQLPLPSRDEWREKMSKPDPDHFMLVAEVAGAGDADASPFDLIGHAALSPMGKSLRRRHAMGVGLCIRDDWRGRGIGTALMETLIDRADNWMGVLRLELTVFADNDAAIALYRRLGFALEGTHRAYALRDGAYVDAHAMARLHPRPPMLPRAGDPA